MISFSLCYLLHRFQQLLEQILPKRRKNLEENPFSAYNHKRKHDWDSSTHDPKPEIINGYNGQLIASLILLLTN